jgi:hypothetical protein
MPEHMHHHLTAQPPGRAGWRPTAMLACAAVTMGASSLTSCSTAQPDATPTLTTVTVTRTQGPLPTSTPVPAPTPPPTSSPAPRPGETSVPGELEGTWQSLDQGSAEVLYTFRPDGRFERAEVLMQSRSSGTFEFAIGTKGVADVAGSTLTLTPQEGVQTLHDPDSPSGSYDGRPLDDLSPETYTWSRQGEDLVLVGKFGAVTYEPLTQEAPR